MSGASGCKHGRRRVRGRQAGFGTGDACGLYAPLTSPAAGACRADSPWRDTVNGEMIGILRSPEWPGLVRRHLGDGAVSPQ